MNNVTFTEQEVGVLVSALGRCEMEGLYDLTDPLLLQVWNKVMHCREQMAVERLRNLALL